MSTFNTLRSAFMAGICIGIAGFGFLAIKDSNYIAACCIFAFALIAVVNYKLALYTGTEVDPNGLPVSEKYQNIRLRAARSSSFRPALKMPRDRS